MIQKINNLIICVMLMMVFVYFQGCSFLGTRNHATFDNNWQTYVGEKAGIWISMRDQELKLIENYRVVKRYRCSTATAGAGNRQDSGMTPVGWHRVAEKIGEGLAAGAVLRDRQWSGQIWEAGQGMQEDLILARILWLEGLEDGLNRGGAVDSRQRYIYIHGTNQVEMLGRPASGGCIRLAPEDVMDLYERVEEGCCVLITEE